MVTDKSKVTNTNEKNIILTTEKVNHENNVSKCLDKTKKSSTEYKNSNQDKMVNKKHRSVVILGDSLLKDIDQHKVRNGVNNGQKIYVKSFSGATVKDMSSYVEPSKDHNNDLIIVHCGTNDLRGGKKPDEISTAIIDLARSLKTDSNDVMVSGILPRRDKLDHKGKQVNESLKSLCSDFNFYFIDNDNISKDSHLNNSGLHLNYSGTYAFGANLVNAIKI